MSEYTVKSGIDAWADSSRASANFSTGNALAASTTRQSFVWLRIPAVKGDNIQVGRLRLVVREAYTGTVTVTARRIQASWKARTLTWANRPGVASGSTYAVTVTSPAVGDVIEFDVTPAAANAANGTAYYGFRIETNAAASLWLNSFESGSGPQLYVQTGQAPAQPSALTPADGVIGKAAWICSADFIDHIGDTDLTAMQVQADPGANGSTPAFDSGAVAVDAPNLDLSGTAFTPLVSGASTQWRTRLQDGAGLWSPWSDWTTVTYRPKAAVTITSPSAGSVGTPTPDITATISSGTAADFRVVVTKGDDRSDVAYDSWRRKVNPDGTIGLELPEKWTHTGRRVLKDDKDYQLQVRVYDAYDRVSSVGDPAYSYAWTTFRMDDDLGQTPPDSVTVAQDGVSPVCVVSWHRTTLPDQFLIKRDDEVVALVAAGDVAQPDGSFRWADSGSTSHWSHTWEVRAVTGKVRSKPASATFRPEAQGVWLMSEDATTRVQLFEASAVDSLRNTDQAGSYEVTGRRYSTRVVTALGGRAAQGMEFVLMDDPEGVSTWQDYQAALRTIKESPLVDYRYYAGGDNLLVRVSNVTITERSDSFSNQVRRLVSFDLEQVGDFEYDGRV